MSGERKRCRLWLKLAAGLLFAVVAYGGAYLACMQRLRVPIVVDTCWPARELVRSEPGYPRPIVRHFFGPAHWLDRRLRPDEWNERYD